LISVNRSADDLRRNRKPAQAVRSDPGSFLRLLAEHATARPQCQSWLAALHERDADREAEIAAGAHESSQTAVNPVAFCRAIEDALPDNALLVADGGDFVATASYVVRPRSPLGWLDPGPFGTLGVGAGFALGAKLARPDTEVWILFGDGSLGYSLTELDTFVRHGVPVLAVVGNDASWAQIARDQVEILGDDVATGLLPTSYHLAAEGLGARGYEITQLAEVGEVLARARQDLSQGVPVLVNAHLTASDFRRGSLSM
jgi:acetolactate synthase-1/2/3 large subunit